MHTGKKNIYAVALNEDKGYNLSLGKLNVICTQFHCF